MVERGLSESSIAGLLSHRRTRTNTERPCYSGDRVALNRRLYLVIIVLIVLALAATAAYVRQRAIDAAACETPAPPPPPTTPPPNLPGFAVEPACGTGAEPAKPAVPVKK
jgi:hypothetical protein